MIFSLGDSSRSVWVKTIIQCTQELVSLSADTNQALGYQAVSHLVLARAAADTSMHSPRHELCATQIIIFTVIII